MIRKKITARPPKTEKVPEKTLEKTPEKTIVAAKTDNKDGKKIETEKSDKDKKEIIVADAKSKIHPKDVKTEKKAPSDKVKPDKVLKNVDASKKADQTKPDIAKSEDAKTDNAVDKKTGSEIAAISDISLNNESAKYLAYNPKGRIDPFAPLFREETKKENKNKIVPGESDKPKKPPRPLTPLEKLDLGQLKLVGIISAESGNKALVEEASGKGYIIIKGTYIGIHSGKVVDILKDRIIVEEEDKDMLGQISVRKRELKFQRPAGDDYYEM
ncbi:pilus assembly protein PilP [Desulfobacterales bacterium HSG17]|nr:pilus assembly protein PilP [Desulfobacterales bacterium HSG17]